MSADVEEGVATSVVLSGVAQRVSAQTLVAASVARVAALALQTGMTLLLATAALGTGVVIVQGGSFVLIAQGLLIVAITVVSLIRVDIAVRVLRRRGVVIALVGVFCGAGAVEHGLQPAYSSVLLALVWISAVVESAPGVLVCVLVAWVGFALDVLLEGHVLQAEHGSVAAQSIGELAILLVSSGLTFAAIRILRITLARAPAGLEQARAGASDSLTPALAAAVRGERIGALSRGDPVAITASLSPAERAVLTLLARGLAPKQAARELVVTLATVRSHIASAKRKTGARTLEQLVGLFAESQREH